MSSNQYKKQSNREEMQQDSPWLITGPVDIIGPLLEKLVSDGYKQLNHWPPTSHQCKAIKNVIQKTVLEVEQGSPLPSASHLTLLRVVNSYHFEI